MVFNLSGSSSSTHLTALPYLERPREKARALGVKQLANHELIAILLASGIKGKSVLMVAQEIVQRYGSLSALIRLSYAQWTDIPGISHVKALQMLAMVELYQRIEKEGVETISFKEPQAVFAHFRLRLGVLHDEQLLVIKLNHQLHYQGETVLRLGSQANIHLEMRDVFVDLLKTNTRKFMLIHNHPSGDCTPSQQDIHTTIALMEAARSLGFLLIDHMIISLQGYFSMKQHRLIQ